MNPFTRIGIIAGTSFLFPLALLADPTTPPALTAPSKNAEPKTHTLFMGTDVVVERAKSLYHVSDVVGSSFIVTIDGTSTAIPMGHGSHALKLEQSMKLSSASASLTGLKGERSYTPGNDPRMLRQREKMAVTETLSDTGAVAMGQHSIAQNSLSTLMAMPASAKGDAAQWQAAVDQSQSRADVSTRAMNMQNAQLDSDIASGGAIHNRAENDLAEENFDALDVSFDVASDRQLTKPYLVVVTRFRPRNAPTVGQANTAIYAEELKPIGNKPQRIDFLQGGFPRGFTLEDYQVHLYDHGIEIATNVAPNRVVLTREEAFLYLKIEYLSKHKTDTLPATLAMKKINPGAKRATDPVRPNEFYFVRVSKEGLPLATFKDEACTQPADTAIESMASEIRFFPALEKGKQVVGVAKVLFPQPET